MNEDTNGKKRGILATRAIESIIIGLIVAGLTSAVGAAVLVKVLEERADNQRESVQRLDYTVKEATRAINALTSTLSALEARAEERQRATDRRLQALEDRRR